MISCRQIPSFAIVLLFSLITACDESPSRDSTAAEPKAEEEAQVLAQRRIAQLTSDYGANDFLAPIFQEAEKYDALYTLELQRAISNLEAQLAIGMGAVFDVYQDDSRGCQLMASYVPQVQVALWSSDFNVILQLSVDCTTAEKLITSIKEDHVEWGLPHVVLVYEPLGFESIMMPAYHVVGQGIEDGRLLEGEAEEAKYPAWRRKIIGRVEHIEHIKGLYWR